MKKTLRLLAIAMLALLMLERPIDANAQAYEEETEHGTVVVIQDPNGRVVEYVMEDEEPGYHAMAGDYTDIFIEAQYGQTEARKMAGMINEFRLGSQTWYLDKNNVDKIWVTGLKALTYDYTLEKVAMQRAAETAISFAHTRPNGARCFTAYEECGYIMQNVYRGENLAAGYKTASEAFIGLREDNDLYDGQGHRRNMLSTNYTAVGIGHVYYNGFHFWAQEYSSKVQTPDATPAVDGKMSTVINVLNSEVSSAKFVSQPETMIIPLGASAEIPAISVHMNMAETWPSWLGVDAVVTGDYAVDSKYLSINGNKVTALQVGSTNITVNTFGASTTIPVTITKSVEGCTMDLEYTTATCTGKAIKPTVVVKDGTTVLTKDVDYKLAYTNNTYPGTAKAVVAGLGAYTGKISKSFTINLAQPKLTSATAVEDGIIVKWSKAPGADGYYIYKKTPGESYVRIATVEGVGNLNYTDKTANHGVQCIYTVKAYYDKQKSTCDQVGVSAVYVAPTEYTTLTYNESGMVVKWKDLPGTEKYVLYRKVEGGSWVKLTTIASGKTMRYADATAEPGMTYIYGLRSYVDTYKSVMVEKSVTLPPATPVVTLTNLGDGVKVSWKAVPHAEGYRIYRKTGTAGYTLLDIITDGTKNYYADRTAVMGKTYSYAVRSYVGDLKSGYGENEIKVAQVYDSSIPAPTFKVAGIFGGRTVTFSTEKTGAVIYYSTTTPNITTSKIKVDSGETVTFNKFDGTIYARTYYNGKWSDCSTLNLTIPVVDKPTISTTGSGYFTLSTTTPGCYLYYTSDGTTPSMTNGTRIAASEGKVYIGTGKTVKVIAVRSSFTDSAVATYK